ncbi:MAG: hypothetical protein FIB06_07360 [Betaproteobacteria bacterium]|nr:hypothetical protein [Betaproteobacteria bacterium]
MDDTIIARADALMQRRRHSALEAEDLPVLTEVALPATATPASGEDDDIPTLTRAIEAPVTARPSFEAGPVPTLVDIQALGAQLAARIEQQIVAQLPRLIDEAVAEALAEHKSAFSPTPPTRPSS